MFPLKHAIREQIAEKAHGKFLFLCLICCFWSNFFQLILLAVVVVVILVLHSKLVPHSKKVPCPPPDSTQLSRYSGFFSEPKDTCLEER